MDLSRQLRYSALIFFILLVLIHSSNSRYHGRRHKRHNGAHMYLPESFIVPNGEGDPEEWSEWSSPSECSRSCGGGVSFQSRECLRYASNGGQQCSGGSRKYFSCNTQDCPEEEPDFRAHQCSRFDGVPFDGVRYEWVPYTNAPNPCELNCMPRGERFYYRHKAKVIDGTRCNDKTLDVCVDGECQAVGCDMMLGSNAREDKCRKCAGDGSSCKTISGLFETNNLAAGYNDILLIPIGATNIVLKEVAPSNNYLACRNLTGHYYLNGNWRIDFPRPMHFAGSWWHYQRKPTGFAAPDQLTCSGPTTESMYVVMLIQDRNVGVEYEYSIPEVVTKSFPDTYSWTHMEYGPCSASCGGGLQSRNVTCNNRLTLEKVDDSLCDTSTKPHETQVCGTEECAPHWVEGVWNKCSKTCGKEGVQSRTVSCERISTNGVASTVEDSVCLKAVGNKPADKQECNREVKICPKFHIGPWSACNTLCGEGKRFRKVTCYKEQNGRKKVLPDDECADEKPTVEEACMLAPCEGVDWIISQWSGCEKCGQTKETRTAICGSKSGKLYDEKFCSGEKPELYKLCKSTKCLTQWFTSQWSECSAKCGKGVQSRIVICGEFDGTTVTPASDDSKCNAPAKPESEQECNGQNTECPGEWFTGPWGKCSKSCGGGQRSREVMCLANGTNVSTCEESKIEFGSENCNNQPCTDDETIPIDATSRAVEDDEESDEECDEDYDEQDFGVEFVPEKQKENLQLSQGVELDTATTTLSSLIMDDLMLSDAPSAISVDVTPDLRTELPETTFEGSGESIESTISSTFGVSEGSGDEIGDDLTTKYLDSYSTKSDSTEYYTDKTQSFESSTYISEGSRTEISSVSPTSVTQEFELSTLVTGNEPDFNSESTIASSENISSDTSIVPTGVSDASTISSDISSASDISSTLLTESSTRLSSEMSTDSSSTLYQYSITSDTTSDSSTDTLASSTKSTSDSSTETTDDSSTETTIKSSTEQLSENSTYSTWQSSTETTSEIITETTSERSTETTLESSTETTSEHSTETTLESTTETTSDSSTATSTEITFESSIQTTLEGSTETLSESSTETTSESSTEATVGSSTETTMGASTEITMGVSTETTSDSSTETTFDLSTESTSEGRKGSTLDVSLDTSIDTSSSTAYYTTETDSTYLTTDPSDSSDETTGVTDNYIAINSDTTTDTSEASVETVPTGANSLTTDESATDVSVSDVTTDVTAVLSTTYNPDSTNSDNFRTMYDASTLNNGEKSSDMSTTEIVDTSPISPTVDGTTVDIWSSEESKTAEDNISQTTPNTLEAALDRESKPRKCRPKKPRKEKCVSSEFGCCPDKKTQAKGPFGLACPVIKTCSDSEFGCCADGLSPAQGKHNKGCPNSKCAETLFGCCPDNLTPAENEDNEGCPEPTTEAPTSTVKPEEDTEETTLNSLITDFTESSSQLIEESDSTYITEVTESTEIPVKTVKSCSFDKFGCCPDGKTTAKGENFSGCDIIDDKDCAKSLYGCCRDRKSSARGPNEEGCALCTREPYGCCPDGVTPAHGELGEGCCLNTQFGCCPDNINAARGPNFQDCDCKYTPYGCCPDNTTAARSYNNDGCDCDTSTYGCCPDKITPAAGDKFAGCPCHTMQFGCCPDGVTIPQGPHHYGCHCSQTEYKCCSDEKTSAKGPNFEGCTCAESKFGCCPDGNNEAQGEKFEGCELSQESPQKACGLPKDTGTCSNFTIKYFFDTSYGACARFWYGGCDGNGNRFETEAECRNTCQEYKGKDTCLLPKSAGPCPGFQKKWYFNSETNRCEEFNYGGCYGTSNRFDSLDECKAQCSMEESLPPCEQPADQGPCQGDFKRWHYDNETDTCRKFTYGGCKANKNNYITEHACNYHCRQPGVHKDICTLPKENGSCGGNHARWHFSENDQKCLPFYYTGCGGNKNNFKSMDSCKEHCPKKIAKDICEIPAEVGECQNYIPRWYWDTKDGRCRQFYYGGCGGNGNNFAEEEICSQRCERKPTTPYPPAQHPAQHYPLSPEVKIKHNTPPENSAVHGDEEKCLQAADSGDCNDYVRRWFYNADDGICNQFIYRGCRGNTNNFESEEECENSCFHVNSTCSLPPVYGNCNESTTRWHYDEKNKRCFEFEFSNCGGNRNNFFTEQECMDFCQNTHPEEESPHTEGYKHTADDQCDLPLATGDCRENVFSWYYNNLAKQCEGFYYTGCNGNANRFESREQCDRQCGQFKDVDQTINENDIEVRPDEQKSTADRCESFEEQCRALQCPFGSKSTDGSDGCRRCECIDPCANYLCPNEEKCVVDVSSDPSLEAKFIPICRETRKPGDCPKLLNNTSCHRECYDDADCRDDNKCCSEGCGHVCVRPHQSRMTTTTLSPPTPRTEVIFPGEAAAALEPKKPEEVEVTSSAGSVAVLRCFATGNPPPIVTWRRGAVLIDTNKGRYVLTSSGDLTIVQVHQSDSGSYICVATNGLGAPVSREVNLQVSDTKANLPAYIYGPKNVTQIVTIKQPAVVRCPAGGFPKPHVNWWRGKNRMALTTVRYDTKRDYSLVFRSIELSDLGPYECSAWTGHGKPASMVVVLKAVGPLHVTNRNDEPFLKYILNPAPMPTTSKPAYPFHPSRKQVRPPPPHVVDIGSRFGAEKEVVTYPPYKKSVSATALIRRDLSNNYTVGSDIVLNCDVEGYPVPNVTWSKDSHQVFSSNRVQITENPHRLVIYAVTAEDSGYYGCTARNTFSFNTSEEKIIIESGVFVRPDCTDNKYFANCALIVKGRYCSNEYYAKFCCRSCTLAGQLPGGHPNSL